MAAPWRGVFPGTWTPSDAAFFTVPPGKMVSEAMLGPAASGAVSLSLAATEGADLASATARLAVSADLAATEGADLASGAITAAISAALSATEGADIAASNVSLLITASMAAVEGADSCSASMDVVAAGVVGMALNATEGADTCLTSMDLVGAGTSQVDQTKYGMGGTYSFGGSSVPIEDDDETLDGFLRSVPLVPATPLAQPSAPMRATIAAGPTPLDMAFVPIVSEPAPVMAAPDPETLALQEAEALRKKHHNHALRLLLLAS